MYRLHLNEIGNLVLIFLDVDTVEFVTIISSWSLVIRVV